MTTPPQVLILAFDDWLANQLREAAAERRWHLHEARQVRAFKSAADEPRTRVAVVQLDPATASEVYAAVAALRRSQPDTAIIVVSDAKVPDDHRAAWAARWFDLGARFAMFPPLTRAVLEDAVVGLMDREG